MQALLQTIEPAIPIPEDKRVDGEAFNISNGEPWLFWGAARFVSTAAGYPVEEKDVWKIPLELVCFFMAIWELIYWLATFGGTPEVTTRMLRYTAQVRTFDIMKARKRLGYDPKVSVPEGLSRAVEWRRKQERGGQDEPHL
jgi:sterol-4alpha-carboxylate 3-dehydrogenase (decarboxylating)